MSRILIGLAVIWVFAGGFASTESAASGSDGPMQRDCKPCKRPNGSLNHSPNVTDLVLDKTELRLNSVPSDLVLQNADRSPDLMINVATNADDAENDVLDYYYVVSGGRIVGSGSNVQWDLNGVPPGTYTITARVDDSCGVCGKTITKGVMIIGKTPIVAAAPATPPVTPTADAPPSNVKPPTSVVITRSTPTAATRTSTVASLPCACPKIMISDPETSGTDLLFTAKIFDTSATNRLTYIWTIVGGSVVSQDGRSIRVKPGVVGGSITLSVNGFDPKCSCPNRAEKTF